MRHLSRLVLVRRLSEALRSQCSPLVASQCALLGSDSQFHDFSRPSSSSAISLLPSARKSCLPRAYCTSAARTLQIAYDKGLPVVVVPLPSRAEPCQFTLRPISDTIASFGEQLRAEDRGIDHIAFYSRDGVRIASTTSIEHLLQFGAFRLRINDAFFDVDVLGRELQPSVDRARDLDDLRAMVAKLHGVLHVDDYKLERERRIQQRLENAELELRPLELQKLEIERECDAYSERVMWTGFALMGVQTGLFARLTWWDFSWDIMEPVTYFATFSTVIATFGYYLYTKQPFEYAQARDRIFTRQFYKRAQRHGFDIERYNALVMEVDEARRILSCIRDPLHLHLPVSYLSKLEHPPICPTSK